MDDSSSAEQANIPRYITADPVDPSSLSFRATDAKGPAAATRNVVSDIMGKVVAGAATWSCQYGDSPEYHEQDSGREREVWRSESRLLSRDVLVYYCRSVSACWSVAAACWPSACCST
jgi:hypothetical protein